MVSPVTGYTHDDASNRPQRSWGVYLGMVGHKTVLESIRATVQARQRRKLFLQGRPVYPLATYYSRTWQHLPDYGADHTTLIADPALPGKWQPGEEVVYQLLFEDELLGGSETEAKAASMLTERLSEALSIPIMSMWAVVLWKTGVHHQLIGELAIGGDCLAAYWTILSGSRWAKIITSLLKEGEIELMK